LLLLSKVEADVGCNQRFNIAYSCLYHTINILLHRAKLKLSREPQTGTTTTAEHNPLIQCISSANSIVALFELYNRTFGEGHVVLALAYSLYTAASIFLLEVQAIGHAAANTLERLSLCVATLERLCKTSPVLSTALKVISRELEALCIQLPPVYRSLPADSATRNLLSLPRDHQAQPSVPDLPSDEILINYENYGETVLLDHFYLNGQADGSMSYNLLDMPPETYEAFSQVEPLSIIMDPGFNAY
jgi:hypothetical protein